MSSLVCFVHVFIYFSSLSQPYGPVNSLTSFLILWAMTKTVVSSRMGTLDHFYPRVTVRYSEVTCSDSLLLMSGSYLTASLPTVSHTHTPSLIPTSNITACVCIVTTATEAWQQFHPKVTKSSLTSISAGCVCRTHHWYQRRDGGQIVWSCSGD